MPERQATPGEETADPADATGGVDGPGPMSTRPTDPPGAAGNGSNPPGSAAAGSTVGAPAPAAGRPAAGPGTPPTGAGAAGNGRAPARRPASSGPASPAPATRSEAAPTDGATGRPGSGPRSGAGGGAPAGAPDGPTARVSPLRSDQPGAPGAGGRSGPAGPGDTPTARVSAPRADQAGAPGAGGRSGPAGAGDESITRVSAPRADQVEASDAGPDPEGSPTVATRPAGAGVPSRSGVSLFGPAGTDPAPAGPRPPGAIAPGRSGPARPLSAAAHPSAQPTSALPAPPRPADPDRTVSVSPGGRGARPGAPKPGQPVEPAQRPPAADQPTDENAAVRPSRGPADLDEDNAEQPTVAVPALVGAPAAEQAGSADADAATTEMLPRADPGSATPAEQPPATPPPADDKPAAAEGEGRSRSRRLLLAAGVAAGLLAVLYGGDLALGAGSMPRGVLVAGVPVGGLPVADAEQRLRAEIEPRATRPVAVTAGEARSELDPKAAGLSVDWPGTLDRASNQPLNPITRITSFFTEREVGVSTATDQEALDSALASLGSIVDLPATEGSVRFEGTTPVPVDPVPGHALDVPAAETLLQREWAFGQPVALPLNELPPTTDKQDVADAIEQVARPAVSAPVVVTGEQGVQGTLTPEVIAGLLTFRADSSGLVPEINIQGASEALEPQLAASEKPGRDASLDFSSGRPVVSPSQDGRGVDYQATLKDLLTVLTGTGERTITAVYADQPAELTTDELNKLGITGVIGEFTTRGFAPDSGKNIRRAAQMINGKIVEPGATFSLNQATAPRTAANGLRRGRHHQRRARVPRRRRWRLAGGHHALQRGLLRRHGRRGAQGAQLLHQPLPTRSRGDRVRGRDRHEVPQRQPDRRHDPDGVDPGVDHGAAVRHQALRGDLHPGAADQPDRSREGVHPGRRAVREEQRRARVHGDRHPHIARDQHG